MPNFVIIHDKRKGSYVTAIKKYCAENKIQIVNNAPLSAKLFEYDTDEYIPCETWEKVAGIMAKGEKTHSLN